MAESHFRTARYSVTNTADRSISPIFYILDRWEDTEDQEDARSEYALQYLQHLYKWHIYDHNTRMEEFIAPLLVWIESLATSVSLEFFVVVGAFLEELLAPIPSPFVMTTAAVLAQVQGYTWVHLAFLVLIASLAKTFSSYLVYVAADKAEDVIIGKFGRYFGISHKHIEKIGGFLTKTWLDDVLLLIARALPIVPTFPISVGAGVIKYNVRSYVLWTFVGTVIRNIFYLWIAYFGWSQFRSLQDELWNHPLWLAIGVIFLLVFVIFLLRAKETVWEKILNSTPLKK
jgi:membrane protein DedA with SNARE-associated domain